MINRFQPIPEIFVGLLLLSVTTAAGQGPEASWPADYGIDFKPLQAALGEGAAKGQVTAVYFTADWCGWCRKMAGATFVDPMVGQWATRFSWAKVDIDEQPDVAASFGVSGVPTLILLNAQGEPLFLRAGYVSPSAMVELLRQHADMVRAPGPLRQRLTDLARSTLQLETVTTTEVTSATVMELVTVLSVAERGGRDRTKQRLLAIGPRVWPGLVRCLADERLAVRAAAYDLLTKSARPDLAFDPFAPLSLRQEQVAAWRQWVVSSVQRHSDKGTAPTSGASDPSPTGQEGDPSEPS